MAKKYHHPQTILAKELARKAGIDPYEQLHYDGKWGLRTYSAYCDFKNAAFDVHYEQTAVDGIWWDQRNGSSDRWAPSERPGDYRFLYGRCKSGSRWFWLVRCFQLNLEGSYGWADTEEQAFADACAAIKHLTAAVPGRIIAGFSHGSASHKLKELNSAKRKARPASKAKDTKVTEYLYGYTHGGEDTPGSPVRFRITKKTAKRIYYSRCYEYLEDNGELKTFSGIIRVWSDEDEDIGFVDRQKMETAGEVYNRGRHWCYSDYHLYSTFDGCVAWKHAPAVSEPDLYALKMEMADAHPDRGGNSIAFIKARERYENARRRATQ